MKPNDRIIIKDKKHPWCGKSGTLKSYGSYGLSFLNLEGWLINLDNAYDTYAKESQLTHHQENRNKEG